ncbi:hypothetical protein JQN58_19555 [Aneurinibacillus sp. BA2021]|nr:hypothetical protein [Aneurinibacillus sp. BA2021]
MAVQGEEMATVSGVAPVLSKAREHLGNPKLAAIGSLFVKWHFSMVALAALYAVTRLNRSYDWSLSNLSFCFSEEKNWNTYVKNSKEDRPFPDQREQWRDAQIQRLFSETVGPVFRAVAAHTGVSIRTLWAHVSFAVYHYYEEWGREAGSEAEQKRLADDFSFLTQALPADWFTDMSYNPFTENYTYVPHPQEEGRMIRLRTRCCFHYCLSEGRYCYTCPGLTEEQRMQQILRTKE